jgi:Uma2 family endonuclease
MQPEPSLSVEEYLALEAIAETKHEYWGGQRFAMAGADLVHNQFTSNLVIALGMRLHPRGCRVLASDQRVQVGLRYFYPDVVVVCQVPDLVPPRPTSLRNPELVVEVLSESTASLDRHVKLYAYLQVESLKEYWMVYQDAPRLMRIVRQALSWQLQPLYGLDQTLRSEHFDLEIPLVELFAQVTFPEEPPPGFTA